MNDMGEEYGHIPDGFLLSEKEVEELRKQKHELTEYGKQKLRELMSKPIEAKVSEEDYNKVVNALTLTHEEMLEEAAKREAAMKSVEKLYDENGDALQQLAAIERQELINEALIELDAIVMGGQNTREFYLSVSHIRNVLERLK